MADRKIVTTATQTVTATRKRKIGYVKFVRPTLVPKVGFVTYLKEGEKAVVDRPASEGLGVLPPEMWWLVDQGALQVGTRFFGINSPAIECWDCD